MKKRLYIISMAVAALFASCQKDGEVEAQLTDDRAVSFSAESIAPLTRVSGSSWNQDDAIGITTVNSNSGVCDDNVKYLATDDGLTTSFKPDSEVILYPEDGESLVFTAYYPYQEGWSSEDNNMILDISTQDGTAESQNELDFLNSRAIGTQGKDVVFSFDHSLSKVQISVSNHDELSVFENLDNLTATLYTDRTKYDYFNFTAVKGGDEKPLGMVKTIEGDKAIFTAIIAPSAAEDNKAISHRVVFTDGENTYTADLTLNPKASKQYNFTATVGDQGLTLVAPTSDSVTDWDTQTEVEASKDIEITGNDYKIYSAKGMKMFADMVNGGQLSLNGQLMNDIDLEGSEDNLWTPIGNWDNPYSGTFDGAGHEVSGIHLNEEQCIGLFGKTSGATIKNIGVDGNITGEMWVGGVVGVSINSTIANCYNKANISVLEYGFYIGGITGYDENSNIINCYNGGSIEVPANYIYNYGGGITGCIDLSGSPIITACYSSAKISGGNLIGGIVGSNFNSITITDCFFDNTIFSGSGIGENRGTDNTRGFSTEYMQTGMFLARLNNAAYAYNQTNPAIKACAWKVTRGYPVHDFENEPKFIQLDIELVDGVYEIYTAKGLKSFADKVNAGQKEINAKLVADIELSGEWTPIGKDGDLENGYAGTFNGNGYSITGMQVSGSVYGLGLFRVCDGATIKNLKVGGSVTSENAHAAIIVGRSWNTTFENCETLAGSTVEATGGDAHGGVAGYAYQCSFTDCVNNASVSGTKYVAGIVGYVNDASHEIGIVVTNCVNRGTITAAECAGGIIGKSKEDTITKISDCDNYGDITVTKDSYAAGIIAMIYNDASSIIGCSNSGTITAKYAGEIIGYSNSETIIK